MKKVSLYIHIPFCKSKCIYCDFNSFSNYFEHVDSYMKKLEEEIIYYSKKVRNRQVSTIYIGGGTPSVIEEKHIQHIMEVIESNYSLTEGIEVTIEANPGTVSLDKLKSYKKSGINRISFGVQSFDEKLLKFLGRAHSKDEAIGAVKNAKEAGFDNISLDLIFALPGQTLDIIKSDIDMISSLDIQHISTYSLKYEEGTPLHQLKADGLVDTVDDETDRMMFSYIKEKLRENGFHQYEISNFSKEGLESRHNNTYWIMDEYIGMGLGASSFFNNQRYNNVTDIVEYTQSEVESFRENIDSLSRDDIIFESIMLGLRLNKGIDLEILSQAYDVDLKDKFSMQIKKLIEMELIIMQSSNISLTDKGRDLSNQVFLEFLNEM